MGIKKVLKKLKANAYQKYCKLPLDEKCILLEAGQGKNLNGNMLAMARELFENKAYAGYKVVYVVTKENLEEAKKRFAFYQYPLILTIRNSDEYKKYLACAKYLMTDNSFPPYFLKREQQVYMNTWHGTPLKTLGISDLKNAASLANIQKNYLMCDYALFPNTFTKDVFVKDYMLENLYKGEIVLADYPRNMALLDKEKSDALRSKLGLSDKKLIAYMPTWRGLGRSANGASQKEILEGIFKKLDAQLSDEEIFYVNLHFLIGNTMDFSNYQHIKPFPSEYETYDFLALCDMLVTDYSSVFFDFAITKKKIVLFTYDLEEYMRDRGTYFPIENLPFPMVCSVDELMKEIHTSGKTCDYHEFLSQYHAFADKQTPAMLLDLLIHGKRDGLHIEQAPCNGKETVLVYGGKLRNKQLNELLLEYLKQLKEEMPDKNIVVSFHGKMHKQKRELLEQLNRSVSYYAVVNKFEFSLPVKIIAAMKMRFGYFDKKLKGKLRASFERERNRMFYGLEPQKVIYFAGNPHYMYRVLSTFHCEKEAHIQHNNVMGIVARRGIYHVMYHYFKENYDTIIDHRFDDVHALWKEEDKHIYYNKCLKMGILWKHFANKKQGLQLSAICFAYTILPFSIKNLKVKIGEHVYDAHLTKGLRLGKAIRITTMKLCVPHEDMKSMEIQNRVNLYYEDAQGYGYLRGMSYKLSNLRKGKNKRGPIQIYEASETSAYFRQSINNRLFLTVRKRNVSDSANQQLKMTFAYFLAKLVPLPKLLVLYEKESSRYEESASVLYEKLIDQGYKHAYFILDKDYPHRSVIAEKYQKNIVDKASFKHYFLFFKAKTFLGSEALVHAIDLRVANRYALKKLASRKINYVFLQHGVMYMVSLDSESRRFFKPLKTDGKYRVVVSSQKEAQHFIELGHYDPDTLYVCGLPKFDRNTWKEDADKIVIMPTWRPWEYNEARYDFQSTKYYQMLCRIFDAIPEALQDKVVILPHPLFYDALKDTDFPLRKYLNAEDKYDDILKQTKVLITDYSSIAYDAYYRGSNVIFYWEEKAECMEAYGPSTKLMLNEENAYGDICYSPKQLEAVIKQNYEQPQNPLYQKRYEQLVSFHDGNNTERLVNMLKQDHILS